MSPQIKQPIPARRYFPQDPLGREVSKKLVGPLDLRLPHLQPKSYIRAFISHGCISFRLLSMFWEVSPNTERHSSICSLIIVHRSSEPTLMSLDLFCA